MHPAVPRHHLQQGFGQQACLCPVAAVQGLHRLRVSAAHFGFGNARGHHLGCRLQALQIRSTA